jgi:DNA-binding Lrp family transcriptional regulator
MVDTSELTERQREVIHHLPADKDDLAERLDVAPTTAKDHIHALRDNGVNVRYDRENAVYALADQEKVRRVSTKHTGTKTREANNFITEVERTILRRLEGSDELVAPQNPEPGNEDMVLHFTDLHIGDVVEDETGAEIYNTQIARDVINTVTEQVLKLKETMGEVAEYDTLHVLYGGDIITNENIYDGQAFDIESLLVEQMTTAVNALTRQLKTFAREFETVNVIAQPGNHGKTRASGVSKQANMDLVTYRWIDDRLRESHVRNVDFTTSEAKWYRTFGLRGGEWTGFLTHGQDAQAHVDATAASSRDWRGWLNEFDFDVGYRGHYHESRRESVQNGPFVFESPSPKPDDEWTSRIGRGSVDGPNKRLATVHGVSDKRPVTWECVLDDG